MDGLDELQSNFEKWKKNARFVAAAGVRAGLNVLQTAAKSESPGSTYKEIGARMANGTATRVVGKVGLGVGSGSRVKNPHGKYLAKGTKFIEPNHFFQHAVESAIPQALGDMTDSVKQKIEDLS